MLKFSSWVKDNCEDTLSNSEKKLYSNLEKLIDSKLDKWVGSQIEIQLSMLDVIGVDYIRCIFILNKLVKEYKKNSWTCDIILANNINDLGISFYIPEKLFR